MIGSYKELVGCIRDLQSENVNDAENMIYNCRFEAGFLDLMYEVIHNNKEEEWVRTLAATFLNRILYQNITEYSSQKLYEGMVRILSDPYIKSLDKRCFQRTLIRIFQQSDNNYLDQWISLTLQLFSLKPQQPHHIDTAYLLVACFAVAEVELDYLFRLIRETFVQGLNDMPVDTASANLINEILKTWIVVFDQLVQRGADGIEVLNEMCMAEVLFVRIKQVYEMEAHEEVYITTNKELYELNMLKFSAAELNKRVLAFVDNTNKDQDYQAKPQPAYQHFQSILFRVTRTLVLISNSQSESQSQSLMQVTQSQDLITMFVAMLTLYYRNNAHMFPGEWKNILHYVVFPMLTITKEEQMLFQECSNQYNELAEDCCDKQVSGALKAELAKLLETIVDFTAGSGTYVEKVCLESIKVNLKFINTQEEGIPILPTETAFFLLGILSYTATTHKSTVEELRTIFCDPRCMQLSPQQLSRVFLFLAYNYSDVFTKPQQGEFWIHFAITYQAHPTTISSALDFIQNNVDEFYSPAFFTTITNKLMEQEHSTNSFIWQILHKILDYHCYKITEEQMVAFVKVLFLKIKVELDLVSTGKKDSTLDIVEILNLLKSILGFQAYLSLKGSLLTTIWEITAIYPQSMSYNFDDELIKLVLLYLQATHNVPKQLYELFPSILAQFAKDGYHHKSYMALFGHLLNLDCPQLWPTLWKSLISGLMYHHMNLSKYQKVKKCSQKVSIGNIFILLQNFVMIQGSNLDQNSIMELSSLCLNFIPKQDKITDKIISARALNCLYLCHMLYSTDSALQYIVKYHQNGIFKSYDARVLVLCLREQLVKEVSPNIIVEMLNVIIWVTADNHKFNEKIQKHRKKHMKSKLITKNIEDYQQILKKVKSPFKVKEHLSDEVRQLVETMRNKNLEAFMLIVRSLNEENKTFLTELIKGEQITNGKKRIIRKVIGVKSKNDDQSNEICEEMSKVPKTNQMHHENSDEEEEDNCLKRERVKKKNKKKKMEE